MNKKDLENKIYEITPNFFEQKKFIPGETFIYTGWAVYDHQEVNAIIGSLLTGQLGLGEKGVEFEKKFSEYMACKKTLLVNSGSSASLLSIAAAKERFNLKEGDEIITPACGFPTTVNPILQQGFVPCFIDIDETYNISISELEKAVNKKTKGIAFSHTLGNPAKIDDIMEIAKENNLFVIEDCCDAYGATYDGKKCGSFGDLATSSFYPAHNITLAGEGGAISTNDNQVAKIIRSLRDWGRDCYCKTGHDNTCGKRFEFELNGAPYDHKYIFSRIGYNLKPTELQAAMGLEQLKKLGDFNFKRKENFKEYMKRFAQFEDFFELPVIHEKANPVFFGFPLLIKDSKINRKDFVSYLNENKIGTRYLFGGNLTHQPAYKNSNYKISGDLKKTNEVERNLFWLGIHPGMGKEEIEYIEEKFRDYIDKKIY